MSLEVDRNTSADDGWVAGTGTGIIKNHGVTKQNIERRLGRAEKLDAGAAARAETFSRFSGRILSNSVAHITCEVEGRVIIARQVVVAACRYVVHLSAIFTARKRDLAHRLDRRARIEIPFMSKHSVVHRHV